MTPGAIAANGDILFAGVLALLAGLISFVSPCVLPLVPGYLGFLGGISGPPSDDLRQRRRDRRRMLLGVGGFVLGFSAVFVSLAALVGTVGVFFMQYSDILTRVMGVVILIMGFVFIGQVSFMQRTVKPNVRPKAGLFGAPVMGAVFAIGWTPCMGPVLAAIMGMSLTSGSTGRATLLAVIYCVGLGIPFLLVALGLDWVSGSVAFVKRHIRAINIGGGIMLMIIGLLMISGLWGVLMSQFAVVIQGFVPAL